MKKIVALLLCLTAGVVCLSGCTGQEMPFTQKSYIADGAQITGVRIDVQDRFIEVAQSADSQIHMEYFENSKEYYDISVSEDRVLTVKAASDKEWTDYIGGKSAADFRKISLQLPDALLKTLEISTTNEDIILPVFTVGSDLSLSAQGGSLVFDTLNAGNSIRLNAKNGNISGSIAGGYDDYAITCNSKKGKSNLPESKAGGAKTLAVSNNNGDIAIEFVKQ